jgi:hypothetical protein
MHPVLSQIPSMVGNCFRRAQDVTGRREMAHVQLAHLKLPASTNPARDPSQNHGLP